MKTISEITVDDLLAAGWRSTARGEWTTEFFCPIGGSGLAFDIDQARLYEAYAQTRLTLLRQLVDNLLDRHSLPWRIEWDWTCEVIDTHGRIVLKCRTAKDGNELIALAQSVAAENEAGRLHVEALLAESGDQ
jgi:hypothetical protein